MLSHFSLQSVNAGNSSLHHHLDYEEVEEGVHATARYSSFRSNARGAIWGIEETRRFYEVLFGVCTFANSLLQCLRQCGTEFSFMQAFFPKRTRQQLKKKFIREERHHPELVRHALSSKLPLGDLPSIMRIITCRRYKCI